MFAKSKVKKKSYYVIVGFFGHQDWYLYDVNNTFITTRSWTNNPKKAIHFKSENEAEQVGELVLKDDEFTIESYSKLSL